MIQPGESDWDEELFKSLSRPTDRLGRDSRQHRNTNRTQRQFLKEKLQSVLIAFNQVN